MSWARALRVYREIISSKLLMCGGGVRCILLLSRGWMPRQKSCVYMAHFSFQYVVMIVWRSFVMCFV